MTPTTALTLPCIVAACTNPVDVDHRIRICGRHWQHAAMHGPWELTCAVRDALTVLKRRQAEEALAVWLADNPRSTP